MIGVPSPLAAAWKVTALPGVLLPINLVGFLVLAPLAAAASGRVAAHDANFLLALANAYTFWLYAPAYGVAAVALIFRRWLLFAAAGALIACHLTWVLPDYDGARALPPGAEDAPQVRLFTANLRFDNPDARPTIREALAAEADVIFFQEFTPAAKAALDAEGLPDVYPFHIGEATPGSQGTAIYSRLPFVSAEVWDAAGVAMTRATIEIGGRAVAFYNVHPVSPSSPANFRRWRHELEALIARLATEPGDTVVAGDFNMTQHHRAYGEFTALGLRDAQRERGRGNATTWPNGMRKFPPIRIDQVFLKGQLECLEIREGVGAGSDHRPVITTLVIVP